MPIRHHKIPVHNAGLAFIFHRMADCYRFLGADQRFRALAYENAAGILQNMPEDIAEHADSLASLDALKGIGSSIAGKIIEYLQTGRIRKFEQLKKQVPYALLELMAIPGLGPATLRLLYKKLHVHDREELVDAILQNRLDKLEGFGPKKISNLRRALKLEKPKERIPLAKALKVAEPLLAAIRALPGVQRAELAGSIRRKKATIGDIDLLIQAAARDRRQLVSRIISLPLVKKVTAKGMSKVSVVLKKMDMQTDIRLVHAYEFGAAFLYFTGSKEHNIHLRTLARNKGYKLNEYGLFDLKTGQRLAGATEEEMYHYLGLPWFTPEKRLDEGEIEKALIKKIRTTQ